MLALQPVERVEALLDRLEPPGLGLDAVEVGAQLAGRRRRARPPAAREPLGERVELRVDARRPPASPRLGLGQRAARRRRRPRRRRRSRPARRAAASRRPSAWRSRSRSAASSRLLGRVGRDRLDLGELVAVAGRGRARARPRARAARRARAPSAAHLAVRLAVALAQLELLGRRRSRRGSPAAPRRASACGARAGRRRRAAATPSALQVGGRGGAPGDEGAGPPRAPRPGARARSPRRPRAGARRARPARARRAARRGRSKTPSTQASSAPGPDDLRPRPAAHQQVERVGEHRLAGAGLAGDRVQALARGAARRARSAAGSRSAARAARRPVLAPGADGFAPATPRGPARRPGRLRRRPVPRRASPTMSRPRTSSQAETAPDDRDRRADQQDLVEAADEGLVGGVARPAREAAAEPPCSALCVAAGGRPRRRSPAARSAAARRASSRSATGRSRRAPATPVAIPTWRKVLLMPERHPGSLRRGRRRSPPRPIPGLVMPIPMPGEDEAGQQRRPARRRARPRASAAGRPRRAPGPTPEQRPGPGPGSRAAPAIGATTKESTVERQEAQAGLERRVAEHVLDVERQVEEHREHRRREREGDDRDAREGRLAEQRRGRASGRRAAALDHHERERAAARPPPSAADDQRRSPSPRRCRGSARRSSRKSAAREADHAGDVDRLRIGGARRSRACVSVSTIAAMPIGTLTKKIHSQPRRSVISAADQRPDRDRAADRRAPDAERGRALAALELLRDQRQRGARTSPRAPIALQAAGEVEDGRVAGEPAGERGEAVKIAEARA